MRISDWSSDVCSSDLSSHCIGGIVFRCEKAHRQADDYPQHQQSVAQLLHISTPGFSALSSLRDAGDTKWASGQPIHGLKLRIVATAADRKSTRLNSSH